LHKPFDVTIGPRSNSQAEGFLIYISIDGATVSPRREPAAARAKSDGKAIAARRQREVLEDEHSSVRGGVCGVRDAGGGRPLPDGAVADVRPRFVPHRQRRRRAVRSGGGPGAQLELPGGIHRVVVRGGVGRHGLPRHGRQPHLRGRFRRGVPLEPCHRRPARRRGRARRLRHRLRRLARQPAARAHPRRGAELELRGGGGYHGRPGDRERRADLFRLLREHHGVAHLLPALLGGALLELQPRGEHRRLARHPHRRHRAGGGERPRDLVVHLQRHAAVELLDDPGLRGEPGARERRAGLYRQSPGLFGLPGRDAEQQRNPVLELLRLDDVGEHPDVARARLGQPRLYRMHRQPDLRPRRGGRPLLELPDGRRCGLLAGGGERRDGVRRE